MTEDRGGFRLSSPSQARFRNSSRLAAPQDPPTQILGLSLTSGRHEKRLPKDAGAVFEQALVGEGFCRQSSISRPLAGDSSADKDFVGDDGCDDAENHWNPGTADNCHRGDASGAGHSDDHAGNRAHGAQQAGGKLHRRDEFGNRAAQTGSDVRRERGKGRVSAHTGTREEGHDRDDGRQNHCHRTHARADALRGIDEDVDEAGDFEAGG